MPRRASSLKCLRFRKDETDTLTLRFLPASLQNLPPLTQGQGVHQPAFRIKIVEAARQTKRVRPEEFVINLPVVSRSLDGAIGPFVIDAEQLAEVAIQPEQPAHEGILGIARLDLVDLGPGYAHLLGADQREVNALENVSAFLVTLASVNAEWLLGDEVGQDHPVIRLLHGAAGCRHAAGIVRVAVAASCLGGGERLLRLVEQQRVDLDTIGSAVVRDVELERRARYHADGGAVELLGRSDIQGFLHHERLASVEIYRDLIQVQLSVTRKSQRAVADEHVDLARLQDGKPHLRGKASVFYFLWIAEHSRRDDSAIGNIASFQLACGILEGKAGDARIDAACQLSSLLYRVERRAFDLRLSRPGRERQYRGQGC